MPTRRTLLQGCTVAAAALPLVEGAPVFAAPSARSIYRVVSALDTDPGRAFAAEASRLGASSAVPSEGVTALWANDLNHRWRASGDIVVGMTDYNTWFVLDLMASGHGMRTVYRAHHQVDADGRASHEVFGAADTDLAEALLDGAQRDWPQAAARALVVALQRTSLAAVHRTVGPARNQTLKPGDLISWVIAAPVRT